MSNEANQVSGEDGQISLSVSRDNEESRTTRCITHFHLLPIIGGNVGDDFLCARVVESVLLKLLWKSGILLQQQAKGVISIRWLTIFQRSYYTSFSRLSIE